MQQDLEANITIETQFNSNNKNLLNEFWINDLLIIFR